MRDVGNTQQPTMADNTPPDPRQISSAAEFGKDVVDVSGAPRTILLAGDTLTHVSADDACVAGFRPSHVPEWFPRRPPLLFGAPECGAGYQLG